MACQAPAFGPLLIVLLIATGAVPSLAWGGHGATTTTTDVACSAGLVAVKFGAGIICVAGAGGSNVASGNQIASGDGVFGAGSATDTTTAGNGGSITGRKMLTTDTNVACSAGLVAVEFGKGVICVAGDGGSNYISGNQVLSGNGAKGGSATDTTKAGDGGSITGRKLLTTSTSTDVACSAGLVAVKFGKGIICVAGAGGSNLGSGNQVASGNGFGGSGTAKDTTTAGNGGSITGR